MFDLMKPPIGNVSRRKWRHYVQEMRAEIRKHPLLGKDFDQYAVNDVLLPGSLTAADTSRDISQNIWGSCPWDSVNNGRMSVGYGFHDDFLLAGNANMSSALAGSIGRWSMYGYAGAQVNDTGREGGWITLSSDGDQEGLALLSSAGSFRMVTTSTLALNPKMWFEARVSRSTITTVKGEFFVGLMAPTLSSGLPAAAQPITTTDDTLMTAGDFFGFHCNSTSSTRGGPTEVAAAFCLASGTVNYPTNTTTMMASTGNTVLAADTKVKLGFLYDPNALFKRITSATARQTAGQIKRALIRFFVNNLELPTFLTSDDVANATATQAFPTAWMSPVIAHMNTTGSTPATTSIDWIRCAQLAAT